MTFRSSKTRKPRRRMNRRGNPNLRKGYGRRTESKSTRPGMVISRQLGFPDSMRVKLRYSDKIEFNTVGLANFIFRMNSLFDPQFSIGGHQPMAFDQLSALYDKYFVYGCSMKATWLNCSPTDGANVYAQWKDSSVTETVETSLRERPWVKRASLSPNVGGNPRAVMTSYITTKTLAGLQHLESDEPSYNAPISTNLINQHFLVLYGIGVPASAATVLNLEIELTYYALMYDRDRPPQS